jgi:hypothetical protein
MNDMAYDVGNSGDGGRQVQLTLTLVFSMSSGVLRRNGITINEDGIESDSE